MYWIEIRKILCQPCSLSFSGTASRRREELKSRWLWVARVWRACLDPSSARCLAPFPSITIRSLIFSPSSTHLSYIDCATIVYVLTWSLALARGLQHFAILIGNYGSYTRHKIQLGHICCPGSNGNGDILTLAFLKKTQFQGSGRYIGTRTCTCTYNAYPQGACSGVHWR